MTLLHIYNGSGVASNSIQLRSENGISAHAQLGEADQITIRVEDTAGTMDFVGYKSWRIIDDVFPPTANTLWFGYVSRQRITRAAELGITTGAARVWDLELVECNGWLVRRVFLPTDSTANRGAETIDARMTWFLASRACTGLIYDRGDVASSLVTLDATDYRGRNGKDVLNDMSLPTGFNYFLRYDDATGTLALHFHDPLLYQDDASTFQLSNVLTDLTVPPANPWPPSDSSTLNRDPNRVASGVFVAYSGGSVYSSSAATLAEFGQVDQVSASANVKTASSALGVATHFLGQHDEQDQRVTDVHVWLPPANVRDFLQGQRIQGRFSHFPNHSNTSYWRVPWKSVNRFEQRGEAVYDVAMELTPATLISAQSTYAQLQYTSNSGVPSGPTDYEIVYLHTGDDPESGWPYNPKYGLVTYTPTYSSPTRYRGLTVTGAGTLTVELRFGATWVASGHQDIRLSVYKNGVEVLYATESSDGGLRFISYAATITGSVAVVAGDVISAHFWEDNEAAPSIITFFHNQDENLTISGSLT